VKNILIVGADIDGINRAIQEAEKGNKVTLIEKFPSFGPERIPRDRIVDPENAFVKPETNKILENDSIEFLPYSEIKRLKKEGGKYSVKILKRSLRVHNDKCNDCKACIKVCPVNMFDDFNEGVCFRTAVDYYSPSPPVYNIFKEDMPVCQRTCPINLDIRTYVGLIADGKPLEALRVIREKLPLPGSIGRICPHPCETACNRQYLDEPISICFLKRFAADAELKEGIEPEYETPKEKYPEKG
jgi:heterodisulfide reductase subunit A